MTHARIKLSLLLLAPLLAAPVCSRSILPTYPTGGSQASVEPLLVDAHANSVLALGLSNWDALEPCTPCFGNHCFFVPYPPGWPAGGEHTETVGGQSWRCNFDLSGLNYYLDTHVDPNASRATRRHFMVQLAPVFFKDRKTPPYLQNTAFSSSTMKSKYHRLLDKVFPVLAAHVTSYGDPVIALGLGNEVNAYLNSQASPITAWSQYASFVQDAVSYIRSSWTGPTLLLTAVSTTYYGDCGPGDGVWSLGSCADASLITKAIDLMSQTDLLTFTYYPYPLNNSPDLSTVISTDLLVMSSYSYSTSRPVVIQEAGYPTTASPAPQSSQRQFVDSLFASAESLSSYIVAVDYFPLTDFADWPLKTGFFTESGGNKSTNNWNNFKTKMAPNNCNLGSSGPGVCCSKSCVTSSSSLQCGGGGCGGLPGGGAACCSGTIENNGVACDATISNAPCNLNCNGSVCCSTGCVNGSGQMQCGGSGCEGLPGGGAACCTGTILSSNRHCDGDPSRAPCIRP